MARPKAHKTDRLIVTLYPEVGKALRELAVQRGVSMGDVVTELLINHAGVPKPARLEEKERLEALEREQQMELATSA